MPLQKTAAPTKRCKIHRPPMLKCDPNKTGQQNWTKCGPNKAGHI